MLPLVAALEAEGVRARWDRQLVAGKDWHKKLEGMMTTCRAMQGNRVKRSFGDEADQDVVIPCGDFSPEAE